MWQHWNAAVVGFLVFAVHYYSHHIGDFNGATRHLSRLERAIYRDLLDIYYESERPLTDDFDRLARLALISDDERATLRSILDEFFTLDEAGYRNKRADAEIAAYQAMREGGKRGAANRWAKGGDRVAIATLSIPQCQPVTMNHEPVTINQKEKDSPAAPAATAGPATMKGEDFIGIPKNQLVEIDPAWELPEAWGTDTEALGWRPADILHESVKFRQYWTVGGGARRRRTVKGWRQSWSNWVAKAAERMRR